MADIVYALHQFDAENEDELSFSAGEAIIVLERDDQYGDGWFQGRNTAGDIGLFPQSYTSVEPPTDSPLSSPNALSPIEGTQLSEPIPALTGDKSDLQHTLEQLQAQQTNGDTSSIKSRSSQISREGKNSDDEEVPANSNPRAMLAAKAAANAEKEANNEREREKAERERVQMNSYDLSTEDAGLIDGIQLSDESDEEEVRKELLSPAVIHPPPPMIDTSVDNDNRPRINSSISATSIYPEEFKSPVRPVTPPPLPLTSPITSTPPINVEATPPLPTSARHFALDSLIPSPIIGAGVGLAAGIGATVAYLHGDKETSPDTTPVSASVPTFPTATIPTPIVLASNESPRTLAVNTPPPTLVSHFLNSQQTHQSYITSPSASLGSNNQSRSSSRQDIGQFATSAGTSDTSPRGSSYGNGATVTKLSELPADPTTWGVKEVLTWGRMKGFDGLTLAKFEEHEISGDILLEMDVTMLKEIDLAAFGRRVHIYNAIKELKIQATRAQSTSVNSPGYSGYEPDSPGMSSHPSPALYTPSPFTMEQESRSTRRGSDVLASSAGVLVFDEENISRPPSAGSNFLKKSRQSTNSSPNHARAATIDSFNTLEGNSGNIVEEVEDRDSDAPLPVRSGSGMSFRRPSVLSGGESRKGSMSDTSSIAGSVGASKVKKVKSERGFFALGRSRKAPPKVPVALVLDTKDDRGRAGNSGSRRGTRLFHPFAGVSSAKPGPPSRQASNSSISSPRDGPSSMTPKAVGLGTGEMDSVQPDQVLNGNLMEKLGAADYKGWMRKKGENYNTWKQRFFFLKGTHLYYLKSENELKAKGFINLTGYRVLIDPDIHPGEYAFKIVHETAKTHYFSASEQVTVRNWMKSIMKATIGRDYSATVVSSCNVETMSLTAAQSMNPKPRPPSPASRARVQKERYAGANPNTLTPKDAAILMEFTSPTTPITSKRNSGRASIVPSKPLGVKPSMSTSSIQSIPLATPPVVETVLENPLDSIPVESVQEGLISWVNNHTPGDIEVTDIGNSLRSGRVLVRLLETLSKTSSGVTDEEFAKFRPAGEDANFLISDYFDIVFATWDYISPKVSTDDISMDDMLSGNESQMMIFVERFRKAYPN